MLFMLQRFGTDKVGYTSAPIICIWFISIAGIGIYNFFKFDPTVLTAFNPKYIIEYFQRNKKEAWISLGGIVFAMTGTVALFADLGHFTIRSIQISMCSVTYPAVILAYIGQASFLRKNSDLVSQTFYKSLPKPLYWPVFVVAILAAIIASQAIISGTFSVIQQSLSLGCFPRVKVIYTSTKYEGQVYVPEANYLLMLACVSLTLGLAVVFVMTLTSCFLVVVMIMIWKTHILLIISYILIICTVELIFFSSVLYKFVQGGYLPLAFAAVLMSVMYVWNNVFRKKYYYELENKISPEKLKEIVANRNFYQISGLALFYSVLVQGIPTIFKHYIENVPAIHSILIFVSIKSLLINKVPVKELFLFHRVEPRELNVFRCVVRLSQRMLSAKREGDVLDGWLEKEKSGSEDVREFEDKGQEVIEKEIEAVDKAWHAGIVHLMGETVVVASEGASMGKRIMINYAYNFLKRNLRGSKEVIDIPHERMLKVGMICEL
ncbi:potassium transporter 5 [Quercus suber]|uniref:Potassium transporter 5 n=1 Tax=Quercus suber TaxID=58331 RepID=A0AAW0J4I4_QUESU